MATIWWHPTKLQVDWNVSWDEIQLDCRRSLETLGILPVTTSWVGCTPTDPVTTRDFVLRLQVAVSPNYSNSWYYINEEKYIAIRCFE